MTCRQNLVSNLKDLTPFMLTSDFLSKSQHFIKDNQIRTTPKKIQPPVSSFMTPSYSDKLFWCFYIINKGIDEYKNIDQKVFTIETEMKISLVMTVREHSALLKQHKISAKGVEVELANNPWITINTFHALCIIHNISCLVVKGKMYYRINIPNDNIDEKNLPNVIEFNSNNNFSLELVGTCDKIKKYYDRYWNVNSLEKPLLSISSYKLDDLKRICEKLDISLFNECKAKNKKELYQDIVKKL